ncbi:hypothetical protein RRG08_027228 [Elysia crispata]|uniref:Uncharacterized protein n=1 Tax=Elysia crispata TaxID=231223 RepID=A0AAE1DM32_9GAST|nr:hypothetical protein RRG08_027228 [Elysia crispata]
MKAKNDDTKDPCLSPVLVYFEMALSFLPPSGSLNVITLHTGSGNGLYQKKAGQSLFKNSQSETRWLSDKARCARSSCHGFELRRPRFDELGTWAALVIHCLTKA